MKKTMLILILIYCLQNCITMNNKKMKNFHVNHGFSISKSEDSIQLINFKNCEGVIFSNKYSEKIFGNNQKYFTPNVIAIKEAVTELNHQYCDARKKFKEYAKEQNLLDLKNNKAEFQKALNYYEKQNILFNKNCAKQQKQLDFLDKQFIGFYNEKKQKIIKIQIINFKDDPYKLKPVFYQSWISGWHGWFESNVRIMHYNLETKTITINDDI